MDESKKACDVTGTTIWTDTRKEEFYDCMVAKKPTTYRSREEWYREGVIKVRQFNDNLALLGSLPEDLDKEMLALFGVFSNENFFPNTVFDLGASIGKYSINFTKIFPKCKVHAFEPVKNSYNKLIDNIRENKLGDKITAHNFGFLEEEKQVLIGKPPHPNSRRSPGNIGLYSIYASSAKDQDVQSANFRCLENFCKDLDVYPDFIKLDVEGCEFEILNSIKSDILKNVKAILVEVNYNPIFPDPEEVNKLLLSEGYFPVFPPLKTDDAQRATRAECARQTHLYGRPHLRIKAFNRLWWRA
jgi:FkbM family methyltransferase